MPKCQPIGVFICDNHTAVRLGIKEILEDAGISVIGSVGSVDECLASSCHEEVTVYIVDLNIGGTRGTTIVNLLRELNHRSRIVVYSAYDNTHIISTIYEAGARAYVSKSSDPEILVESVRAVADDKTYFAPGVAEELAIFYTKGGHKVDPRNILTERELTIFTLLAEGRTIKEVAQKLGVTEKSIGNRAVTVRRKLGIPRDQFTAFALEHNIIELESHRPTHHSENT